MMDKEVLKQAQSLTEKLNDSVGERTDFETMLVPNTSQIIDLEEYQETRNIFRGSYTTDNIQSFVKYVADNKGQQCYVDAREMEARVIFDIDIDGKPGHCKHSAWLYSRKTADFSLVLGVSGSEMTQQAAYEFLTDNKHALMALDSSGEEVSLNHAILKIQAIEAERISRSNSDISDFSASKSALESIEVSGNGGVIPSYFKYTVRPYVWHKDIDVLLRVSILLSHSKELKIILNIVNEDKMLESIGLEFLDYVEGKISESCDDVLTYIGKLKT